MWNKYILYLKVFLGLLLHFLVLVEIKFVKIINIFKMNEILLHGQILYHTPKWAIL